MNLKGYLIAGCLFFGSTAYAEMMPYSGYKELKKENNERLEIYIRGMGEAYNWVNTSFKEEWGKPLFCPPKKLGLNIENYMQIIDRQAKKAKSEEEVAATPIGLLLWYGLLSTFPCDNK